MIDKEYFKTILIDNFNSFKDENLHQQDILDVMLNTERGVYVSNWLGAVNTELNNKLNKIESGDTNFNFNPETNNL